MGKTLWRYYSTFLKVKTMFKDVMKKQGRTNLIPWNKWELRVYAVPSSVGCAGLL